VGNFLNSIFLHFCVFYAPFNISGTLEASALKFHTPCRNDGANSILSHSWLAPIGATGGGSKYGVNFGIFKNHSGGPRGGQISTDRSQINIYGVEWLATQYFLNYNFREFPQPVSLSFSGQNSRGYISATLGYIDIKFTEFVDTLSGYCKQVSISGAPPKFGPHGGSNFQVGPHSGPPWRTNSRKYSNLATSIW